MSLEGCQSQHSCRGSLTWKGSQRGAQGKRPPGREDFAKLNLTRYGFTEDLSTLLTRDRWQPVCPKPWICSRLPFRATDSQQIRRSPDSHTGASKAALPSTSCRNCQEKEALSAPSWYPHDPRYPGLGSLGFTAGPFQW